MSRRLGLLIAAAADGLAIAWLTATGHNLAAAALLAASIYAILTIDV